MLLQVLAGVEVSARMSGALQLGCCLLRELHLLHPLEVLRPALVLDAPGALYMYSSTPGGQLSPRILQPNMVSACLTLLANVKCFRKKRTQHPNKTYQVRLVPHIILQWDV